MYTYVWYQKTRETDLLYDIRLLAVGSFLSQSTHMANGRTNIWTKFRITRLYFVKAMSH